MAQGKAERSGEIEATERRANGVDVRGSSISTPPSSGRSPSMPSIDQREPEDYCVEEAQADFERRMASQQDEASR